ncbi:MAG TPA: hypothetical protein VFH78_00275 [Candidatus Thermoplasmatota archaeon]|nr:hypothetical protein [Candidatus Thermoplasmatota archaeon]
MKRALLLLGLMLVPLLPLAEAAGPEPRPWAPYTAGVDVASLALAREGTTMFAGVRSPATPTPGTGIPSVPTPGTTRLDSIVLDHEYGFARSYSVSTIAPDGITHVAVSRDGSTIAALRRELVVTGQTEQSHLQLYYGRIAPNGNWSSGAQFERSINLGTVDTVSAVGLALSDDGRRVAILLVQGTNYVLRGWAAGASSLDSAFELRQAGTPRALAASGDLSRMVVGGQFPRDANLTHGGARVFQFAQADAVAAHYDASANNTDVRSVAISHDGSVVAVGGGDGNLTLFRGARDALRSPATLPLGAAAISNITMSEDGTRLATAIGTNVAALDITAAPRVLWNATVSGQNVTGLAMNRTGAIFVVGTGGTGGGVHAFSDVDGTLLWSIPGDTRAVAIDSAGTRVAYAQRAAIGAARIPRALTMDLATGGKIAPTQMVTVPGTASITVSLRNDGAALERVVFEESSPEVDVRADQEVVTVRPGSIVRTNLTLDVREGLVGQRVFNVTARSLTSGAVDNITVSVVPRPTLDVKLSVNVTDILAQPGQPSEFLVTIVNNGTGDAPVVVQAVQEVTAGPQWEVALSETQLTALRATRTSVKVTVTPPADAANGTAAFVTLTLAGQDIFDSARVTLRINPELKVEVNATGVTKLIEPGRRASYNVTVANIGSLARDFDVFYTIVASDSRNWGVEMPSEVVRLEPNARRTFPVTIVAPADALPQERVAVRVTARSIPEAENETIVSDEVTLFGIAVEPRITTTTTPSNGIPFLAPLAAVAALLVAALLPGRRRQ